MSVQDEKMSSSEQINELVTPRNYTCRYRCTQKQIITPPSWPYESPVLRTDPFFMPKILKQASDKRIARAILTYHSWPYKSPVLRTDPFFMPKILKQASDFGHEKSLPINRKAFER